MTIIAHIFFYLRISHWSCLSLLNPRNFIFTYNIFYEQIILFYFYLRARIWIELNVFVHCKFYHAVWSLSWSRSLEICYHCLAVACRLKHLEPGVLFEDLFTLRMRDFIDQLLQIVELRMSKWVEGLLKVLMFNNFPNQLLWHHKVICIVHAWFICERLANTWFIGQRFFTWAQLAWIRAIRQAEIGRFI